MESVEQVREMVGVAPGWKRCTKCGEVKPLAEFYKSKASKDGFASGCKSCRTLYAKKKKADLEMRIAGGFDPHAQEKKCKRCGLVLPGTLFGIRSLTSDGLRSYCLACDGAISKMNWNKYKRACFNYYGWTCAGCGENNPATLTIDHINGGGSAHRRQIGSQFYKWLVKHNFPRGFRTLCGSCQMIAARGLPLPNNWDGWAFGINWKGDCGPEWLGATSELVEIYAQQMRGILTRRIVDQEMLYGRRRAGGPVDPPNPRGCPLLPVQ